MARSFNGSSNYGQIALDLSAHNKITVAFWLWSDTNVDTAHIVMEHANADAGAGGGRWHINHGSSAGKSNVTWVTAATYANYHAVEFTRPSAAAWHHWIVTIDGSLSSSQIVAVYIDGVSVSLTSTNNNAGASSMANQTLNIMSRAGSSLFHDGDMAEMAIWGGVTLDATEAATLGKGYAPPLVRPASLTLYVPMLRDNVALRGAAPTFNGTTIADHPRMLNVA